MGTLWITSANDGYHSQPKSFAEEIEDPAAEEASEWNRSIVGPLLDSLFFPIQ